jgi:hypothetical protein
MITLPMFLEQQGKSDIFTIGQYIQQHVNEHWEAIFQQVQPEMVARYEEIGDGVYGIYGTHLFREIHAQFKASGFRAVPRLPGNFNSSREWGDDETDRQRWMWSKISTTTGEAVGTIATGFYHDHIEIRIPRPFKIVALPETTKRDVERALGELMPEFKQALEARIEYAAYYQ